MAYFCWTAVVAYTSLSELKSLGQIVWLLYWQIESSSWGHNTFTHEDKLECVGVLNCIKSSQKLSTQNWIELVGFFIHLWSILLGLNELKHFPLIISVLLYFGLCVSFLLPMWLHGIRRLKWHLQRDSVLIMQRGWGVDNVQTDFHAYYTNDFMIFDVAAGGRGVGEMSLFRSHLNGSAK